MHFIEICHFLGECKCKENHLLRCHSVTSTCLVFFRKKMFKKNVFSFQWIILNVKKSKDLLFSVISNDDNSKLRTYVDGFMKLLFNMALLQIKVI